MAGPCRQTERLGVLHPVALDLDDGPTTTQRFARNGLSYCVPWAPVLLVVAGIWIFSTRDGIATPVHEGPEAVKRAPVATTTSTHRRTPQNPDQVALLSDEINREQRDWEDGLCRIRNKRVFPIIIRPFVGRDPGPQIGKNPWFVVDFLTQTLVDWVDRNRRRSSTHVALAVLRHINSVTELSFFAWVRPKAESM